MGKTIQAINHFYCILSRIIFLYS